MFVFIHFPKEVDVERSPSKIGAVKPKVYLTCALRIPPSSWCKLSAA